MKANLNRKEYYDKQVLGELTMYNDSGEIVFRCKTLELAWRNNETRVSCIPTGTYKAVPRYSPKYKEHFHVQELNAPDVNGRSMILIHQGNYNHDILGCILVGSEHLDINKDGYADVVNSVDTLAELRNAAPEGFIFEVTGKQYPFPPPPLYDQMPDVVEFAVEGKPMEVIVSAINFRQRPSTLGSRLTDPLPRGTKLEFLENWGKWAKVRLKVVGWVSEAYVDYAGSIGIIVASALNIRTEPVSGAAAVCDPLPKNTEVRLLDIKDGWLKVEAGLDGFVTAKYIGAINAEGDASTVTEVMEDEDA